MNEKPALLREISDYLGTRSYSEKLLNMEKALAAKEYLLVVMGQFSAGKSRLINNLLQKDVLPVHTTETTAVITFIRYGEDEYANLTYNDGSIEDISIEESLKLWQSGEGSEQLQKLARVNLFVKSDLLKNGLVIADTPGVNTVINKHLELTAQVIGSADRVLYVMRKTVAETDLDFIKKIRDTGAGIIFVRTHMDELKKTEEDIAETVKIEADNLSDYTNDDVYFVSNEKNNYYYGEIDKLRGFLSDTLAENVEQALEETVNENARFIAEKLLPLIDKKKADIDDVLSKNKDNYLRRKKECENALESMTNTVQKNKKKFAEKTARTEKDALDDLAVGEKVSKTKLAQMINELDYGDNSKEYAQRIKSALKSECVSLQTMYISSFDRLLKDNKRELEAELQNYSDFFGMDIPVPDDLAEAGKHTRNILERIEALKILKIEIASELENIQNEKTDVQNKFDRATAEHEAILEAQHSIQEELNAYPEYETQYYEARPATHTGENVMRDLGKVADIATLFIPGTAWASLGAKILNIGAKGAKAVKAVNTASKLAKAAETVKKSAAVAKAVDAGVDIARIGSRVKKELNLEKMSKSEVVEIMNGNQKIQNAANAVKESTSILDFLSLEYWFAKIGRNFDTPPIYEIDLEYERRYNEGKQQILKKQSAKAEAELNKRCEMLDITDKQKKLELKAEIDKKKLCEAEAEERELKRTLEEAQLKDTVKALRKFYTDVACENITNFCEYLRRDVSAQIKERTNEYASNFDFDIMTNINRKRNEIEELSKMFESSGKEQLEKESALCAKYRETLEKLKD